MTKPSNGQEGDHGGSGPSATESEGLTRDHVRQLLDVLDDPYYLRRYLVRLSRSFAGLRMPDVSQVEGDLVEALRRLRAGVRRPNLTAQRRYRTLELLVVERMTLDEAASAQYVSPRTIYRARLEGFDELAAVLTDLWSDRVPAPSQAYGTLSPEAIPRPAMFVGRQRELAEAIGLLDETRFVVIGGPAGIGKTSFAAMLAHEQAAMSPVLWHRLRLGLTDSVGGVLFAIGQRLSDLGGEALLAYMNQTPASVPWQAVAHTLAAQAMDAHRLLVVLDDGDAIARNPEVCSLLSSLHADTSVARLVVVARERMGLLQGAARFELFGLDVPSTRQYLALHGLDSLPDAAVDILVPETGGNPQLLHLAAGALLHGQLAPESLEDQLLEVPDVRAFFFDQIYRQLSTAEQVVLGAASLVRRPATASFLSGALEGLIASVPATLSMLAERFLFTSANDGLRLHSTVREFARRMLASGDAQLIHARFATSYQRAGDFEEACHHWIEAGEYEQARRALLANRPASAPHIESRLGHLVQRLFSAGMTDDPGLLRFAEQLGSHRPVRRRPSRPY